MIPAAMITAALQFATEGLRAFNELDAEQRHEIVDRLLKDDAARRSWWDKVCAWATEAIAKIKL